MAVMVFVLWPVTVPVGFSEVWWASRQAAPGPGSKSAPKPKPASSPTLSQAPSPHAVAPSKSAPPPSEPAAGNASGGQVAALKQSDDTGALLPATSAPQAAAPKAPTKLYHRVAVRDGGTIQSGKMVIRLAGIAGRDADAKCKNEAGKTWPCGAAAKAALTRLIRTRAVTCTLPKSGEHNIFEARCSVGTVDLSVWMVQQGWAEAKDPSLANAAKHAKAERLGLWQ
jgi:endonuclease YncB( thermonuclease family)